MNYCPVSVPDGRLDPLCETCWPLTSLPLRCQVQLHHFHGVSIKYLAEYFGYRPSVGEDIFLRVELAGEDVQGVIVSAGALDASRPDTLEGGYLVQWQEIM